MKFQSGGLFGKWPLYPMFGLGAAILLSKELLMVNEEFLVGCSVLTFTMASYIMFQEQVSTALDSSISELRERQIDATDLAIDHVKRLILLEQQHSTFPEDVKALHEEETNAEKLAVEYQNAKHHLDIKTTTLQKLQTLHALEAEELEQIKGALIQRAGDFARAQFEASSEEEKAQLIDETINLIPSQIDQADTQTDKPQKDRITGYFDEYFKRQYTLDQLGITSRVATFLTKEQHTKH